MQVGIILGTRHMCMPVGNGNPKSQSVPSLFTVENLQSILAVPIYARQQHSPHATVSANGYIIHEYQRKEPCKLYVQLHRVVSVLLHSVHPQYYNSCDKFL